MRRFLAAAAILMTALLCSAQGQLSGAGKDPKPLTFASSSCASCHGSKGEGGAGPKLAGQSYDSAEFLKTVRKGKGIMPPTGTGQLSDHAVESLRRELDGHILQEAGAAGAKDDIFSTSSCMGCHGQSAMGGLGPPLAQLKLNEEEFLAVVRKGKGMMPGTSSNDLSDEQALAIRTELQQKPYLEDQIPIAFKVSQFLTTKNVFRLFAIVLLISLVLAVWQFMPWVRCSGVRSLAPIRRLGLGACLGICIKSLAADALLVQSLWKADRFRWFMHGLMLYGFLGLLLADVLMSVLNPLRADLGLTDPLKLLPLVCGGMVFTGLVYVMIRYKTDRYIDNGLTLSGDFLFLNLMIHVIVSGFLTFILNRMGVSLWVMPLYIYHLSVISALFLTAPFSRFQHVWVVPYLMVISRLTDAVVEKHCDLGFEREPSPGRHHKSAEIVQSVLSNLGSDYSEASSSFRYYP